jgi:hypothetical protein
MSIRASVRSPPATDVVPMGCEESSFDRCLRLCPFSLAEGPRALCSARVHPGCFLWTAAGFWKAYPRGGSVHRARVEA